MSAELVGKDLSPSKDQNRSLYEFLRSQFGPNTQRLMADQLYTLPEEAANATHVVQHECTLRATKCVAGYIYI